MKIVQCDESCAVQWQSLSEVKLSDQARRKVMLSRVIGGRWGKEY